MACDKHTPLVERKKQLRAEVLARRDAIDPSDRETKSDEICGLVFRELAETFNADLDGDSVANTHDCNTDFDGDRVVEHSDNNVTKLLDSNSNVERRLMAGKKIAVYQAMRSEVDLEQLDRAAYAAGACVCFPCMMKRDAAHSLRNIAYEGQRSFMVFRKVPQARFESGDIPFAANPLKFYEFDDPMLVDFPIVEPEDLDAVIVPLVAFDEHFNRMGYGGGNYDHLLPRLRNDAVVIGVAFAEQQVESLPLEPHDQPLPNIVFA